LCQDLVADRHRTRLLRKCLKEDDEAAGALVEHSVAGAPKPNSQLPQLTADLGGDRKLGGRGVDRSPTEVLLDVFVDLGCMHSWEGSDERGNRFDTPSVAIVDSLGS